MFCKSNLFWKRSLTKWWTGSRNIHSQPSLPYLWGNKRKVDSLNIIVENTKLESTSSIKVLCVNIDSKLNFNDRVCDMCTKARRQLNVWQWMQSLLDYDSRIVIFKSFIVSNFDYCPWSGFLPASHPCQNCRVSINRRLDWFQTTMNRTTTIY